MTTNPSETETADDFAVITLVTRLHAAASAGLALLEAVEHEEENYGASDELRVAMHAARAAHDRLAEIDTQAAL